MTKNETAADRINTLAVEATQTLVDAAYLAQRQSAELLQAWLNTLDAGQKQQREIAARLVQQAQEGQRLLQQYVQESVQTNVDTFTKATQAGFKQVNEAVSTVAEQVNSSAKRAESASK